MPSRQDFQQLAHERLVEAKLLLDHGHWSGAYYLSGYAVECGLKACIAGLMKADEFPDKEFAQKCYTHSIEALVSLANLSDKRTAYFTEDDLSANWLKVKDWKEDSRYQTWTESKARSLYDAISDPEKGVMKWIEQHW